jgi:Clp amino terminal domain, pathogenicity island component
VAQRSQQADRVLDLARTEAEWFGHRYLGPEHLVLGMLLREPPLLISQALYHAGGQARTLGLGVIGPELLLLGVVTDIQTPWPRCMRNRWRRQLHASVGLPEGYRGAAGPLLEALRVDLDQLRDAVTGQLGGVQR